MTNLAKLIGIAESRKPTLADPCNHCGWCCMTEVCLVGQEITGSSVIPCKLLVEKSGQHYCSIAATDAGKEQIGAGVGCCAQTQREVMTRLSA